MSPLLQQALAHHQAGRFSEAEAVYQKLLAAQPADYALLHLVGLLRLQQGRVTEALSQMEAALAVQPGAPDTLANYGIALSTAGRTQEALAAFDRALAAQPQNSRLYSNRGAIRSRLGRKTEALADLERALALDANSLDARFNHAWTLHELGHSDQALAGFDRLLAAAPQHAEARNSRGVVLKALGRHDEALQDFTAVITAEPGHAGAHVNRATIFWETERLEEALEGYGQALRLQPGNPEALENRANLLWTRRQQLEPAIADLQELARVAPERPYLAGDLLQMQMQAGDWRNFDADRAKLTQGVRAGLPLAQPFAFQGLSDDPADILRCAQIYAAREYPPLPALWKKGPRRPGPIRIGYVSGEFRAHASMYLAAGLFERHDRARFDVLAFDNGRDDQSPMRARVKAGFDKFISIARLSDRDAAALVLAEEVDILVNLTGYFGKMRMSLFRQRTAPLQVNYLGFPGTLGASYMDYILADHILVPDGDERFYAEQVVRLPHSYQVNDDRRAAVVASTRAEHGLPQDAFVFCHFNYGYKILPDVFAAWMRILTAVPGSVLWLLAGNPLFIRNLQAEASARGVDPARLIFAPPLELQEHLSRLPLGDLFLDTLPCNGHTTASDALWAGLPLLTCRGGAFCGRVAASLLQAAGLRELVTENLAAYEELAVALAKEPARLKALRARLEGSRTKAPLFDTASSTRYIEVAYEIMQEKRLRGEAPQGFAVAS